MKILVVGKGGREHAILWKLARSPRVKKLYCAPGNGGISRVAECIDIDIMDMEGMVEFAAAKKIDMVVVAPDDPLSAGMIDVLQSAGIRAFGPDKRAALIEGSKSYAKELMQANDIPTARYRVFDSSQEAYKYLEDSEFPVVVKADGLALGKGVIIAEDLEQGRQAVKKIMVDKAFGHAGDRIVIEEFLEGPEVSVLAFTDGSTLVPMVSSQDHKRALDGDRGLNTGGMGAFSPSRIYDDKMEEYCMERIFVPTVNAMREAGRKFKGVLYFGLIVTEDGPRVLEYNSRFGDPEAQVVLPRLKTDLAEIFDAVIDERLDSVDIKWSDDAAVCVVMASGGYPVSYRKGHEITGLDEAGKDSQTVVFHAGTKSENGRYYTNGGRVLGVTSVDKDLDSARKRAYKGISRIKFTRAHYRKDIGVK